MLRNIFCWKGFGPVTGPPSFPGANFQQMVIARLSLGLSFLGLRNFLKLCHDEKPCTWWLGEKGLGSLQSRLARMLHHEYDALKGYRFLGGGHIVLQRFVHVRCHFQPLPTKLVFAYFDRGSYIHYIQHYIQFLFSAIHNPWANATDLPGRRLTGASLFK